MPKSEAEKLYEEFVDRYVDEEFVGKENTGGIFKSARKAELMQRFDPFLCQLIEELIQSQF